MESSANEATASGGDACPHCGQKAPAGALAGLCPACLLRQGAAGDTVFPGKFTPPEPKELAEHFPQLEILGLIGSGGMGAVYRARQRGLDRIVALKILPPGIGDRPGFAERFTREAQALAKLNHPGIVTIHDTGRANGLYFLLMEHVDGVNLRQLIERGRISPREALAIVPMVCDALQYAHDEGIVHRDIKPENILMDRQGRVKVADFGLAKLVGEEETGIPVGRGFFTDVTAAGELMGTPQYMAPEQIERPGEVDHRADIYSLGVVLYQMLTGELPTGEFEPPSRKVNVDVRLDEVFLRALQRDPERRYQNAGMVGQSVETILSTAIQDRKEGAKAMEIKFNCPNCDQRLSIDESGAGAEVTCPNCSQAMIAPGSPPVPPKSPFPPTPPMNPAPLSQSPVFQPPAPRRARGWAIWSLVLALVGLIPILGLVTGVVGLLLGIVALVKQTTSKGIAIAGTVIGCVSALMIPVHLGALSGTMAVARFATGTTQCITNLKTVGLAIEEYRGKHGGMYPPDLAALVREGMISKETLRCPLHEGEVGYAYSRPPGRQARGIIAWDLHSHKAVGKTSVGRKVLEANLAVRFLSEAEFSAAPKAAHFAEERVTRPVPQGNPARPGQRVPAVPQPTPAKEVMTLESALASLAGAPPRERRPILNFLNTAEVDPERRASVIAALRPLLNDVDSGDMAFQVFMKWAEKGEIPDLVEMVRVAPRSPRGKEAMKLLSRIGDERAAEVIAESLADFHALRDVKASLAAMGEIAKPAVLPYYHHKDGNSREAARELLRGYKATDEEILAVSIQSLGSDDSESRRSALEYLAAAKLAPDKQAEVSEAACPLVKDEDGRVVEAARNVLKAHASKANADFILGLMDSTDRKTLQFASDLLLKFGDARVAKPLAVLLADQYLSYWAGDQLIKLGTHGEPAVMAFLAHDDQMVRRRAADTLSKIGTRQSLRPLEALLNDKEFFVKVAAENAIKAIKAREQ
jgi:serine/threonine protein kinase/HEAT repeat protein